VAAADRKQVLIFADAINAVWMWKKLVLRGSTRDAKGGEQLAYFKGGFGRLAQAMADEITRLGGRVQYGAPVSGLGLSADGQQVEAVQTAQGSYTAREFLFTPALPIIADIFEGSAKADWLASLRRVQYLANACLVLQLDRSLSDTYWLNVNDPGFPSSA
jgi:protoporphyrinogen oxidase